MVGLFGSKDHYSVSYIFIKFNGRVSYATVSLPLSTASMPPNRCTCFSTEYMVWVAHATESISINLASHWMATEMVAQDT